MEDCNFPIGQTFQELHEHQSVDKLLIVFIFCNVSDHCETISLKLWVFR
jgi:hypothetical protein